MNDRKKLGMDSADPQNRSEWRGHLQGRLIRQATLDRGKRGLKMDMMMINVENNETTTKT